MRGVTMESRKKVPIVRISTHTPHARRDFIVNRFHFPIGIISTHTPHARRDLQIVIEYVQLLHDFNSHASCEA